MKKMIWILMLLVSVVLCGCSVRVEYEGERPVEEEEFPALCLENMTDRIENDRGEQEVIGSYEIGLYTLCIFNDGKSHIVVKIWKEEAL